MKLIIAGSRSVHLYAALLRGLDRSFFEDITEVICGGARGADSLGKRWAGINDIKVTMFKAEWDKYGKTAGYIRNVQMADYCEPAEDGLLALWDGHSSGTWNMITLARKRGLLVHVEQV